MTALTLPYPPSSNRYWRMANNRLYRSGYAPSHREIGASIGKHSGAGIGWTLDGLRAKGLITLPGGKRARAISVVRGVRVGVRP